ncbi:MAG TPA: hypothetical protein VGR28_10705, partial [Candidatus Thermoplasmatota archaeon]|nr:hypothetical protein [Candidatus Thermoplasmatota archaeon]
TWTTTTASRNGTGSKGIDPDVAIDRANHVYVVHEGDDGNLWMAASRDRGATWGERVRVNPEGVRSVMFPAAIAGDEGKLAVAYLGTPDTALHGNDAPPWARWHLYVTFVEGAAGDAPAMTTARATPADDPVQIGVICTRGIACPGGGARRNLADFIDASMLPDGRVIVAWTDGCLAACTRASDSGASLVTVSVLQAGPALLGRQANDAATVPATAWPSSGPGPQL